jgi:hypothetical protein
MRSVKFFNPRSMAKDSCWKSPSELTCLFRLPTLTKKILVYNGHSAKVCFLQEG